MSRLRRVSMLVGVGAAVAATPASAHDELSHRLDALSSGALRSASPAEQAKAVSLLAHGPASLLRDGGDLVVEIRVNGDVRNRVQGIRDAGGNIVAVSPEDGLIEAAVAEGDLREVGNSPGVEAVNEELTPMTGAVDPPDPFGIGAINTCPTGTISEGDTQLKAATARTQFDVDGTGVKVGVLSDSFNTGTMAIKEANDIASNDLPGATNTCGRLTPVQVLDDSAGVQADEGRAMLQIVHDMAPGADLAFATAFTGEVAFANNIRSLATNGADIVADDIIYFQEPFFQDGIIANAVQDVTDDGVAYFSMAFNDNRVLGGKDINSWEAPAYRSTTCPPILLTLDPGPNDCMDFDPTAGTDNAMNVTANPGSAWRWDLQWAEPQNGVDTNLDLYVINTAANTIFKSEADNATTGKPFELVSFTPGSSAAGNYQVIIRRTSGSGTPRLKWVNGDNGAGTIADREFATSANGDIVGPTIFGHNGTASAQTVGAVPYNDSTAMEPYSSRGPVTHYFAPANGATPAAALATPEVLSKPDISATDGGLNTFFHAPCGPCRFLGTSAATPHAAGIAALQLSANPSATVAQLKAAQKTSGDPIGAFGPLAAGAGLLDAPDAIGLTITSPAAPAVAFQSGNGVDTSDSSPTLTFTVAGRPSSVTCSLDGAAPQLCTSPFVPAAALADGGHALSVASTDYFAQLGAATASFTVDTTGPTVSIMKGPKSNSTKTKAKFVFSTESGATLRCKLDKGAFESCGNSEKFKVKAGKHTLKVFGTDDLGNVGPVTSDSWKVKKKPKPKK